MGWTDTHGALLAEAFERVLATDDADSKALDKGTMAFVRCLDSETIEKAASSSDFSVTGWDIYRVADRSDDARRTITADRAVEIREDKGNPVLLLVDSDRAGAGMDGIYSAAREINEETLFDQAKKIALDRIKKGQSDKAKRFSNEACKTAKSRSGVSPWSEFDFLCEVADSGRKPGELLPSIGLWPIDASEDTSDDEDKNNLKLSRNLADRFFSATSRYSIDEEFESLGFRPSPEQKEKLHEILNRSKAVSPLQMMSEIGDDLRIGKIEVVDPKNIESIKIMSWVGKNGRPFAWSGLKQKEDDEVPSLIIDPNARESGKYSKLTVKWKVKPEGIRKNDIFYRIVVMAGDEEITEPVEQPHSGKSEEKIIFTNDSFTSLDDDFSISSAKVAISVLYKEEVSAESEIFAIVSGEAEAEEEKEGTGKKVRAFCEGAIDLEDRGNIVISPKPLDKSPGGKIDSKDFLTLTLRENNRNKNYRIFYPPLIHEAERQWVSGNGALGRWTIKVRESGEWAKEKDSLEFKKVERFAEIDKSHHDRLTTASAKMSRLFGLCGGPGQIYDEKNVDHFETVSNYLNAWLDVFSKNDDPNLTLCHTVEVQSLSGKDIIGLIVLPSHPLRVAWHAAYDNLLLHAAFEESKGSLAKDLLKEFEGLDGAMFPAFLPNPKGGAFVFADTLGFHAVGMVPEDNIEPKASIAILARALGGAGAENASPTTGDKSAKILGNEIYKYIECHDLRGDDIPRQIRIHAMRAGAGLTVARALGEVFAREEARDKGRGGEDETEKGPLFLLEFYPSKKQRAVAGRFITEATEKRRRGAGTLEPRDRWMIDSVRLHGDINMPRLRWAKRNDEIPYQAAHLAIAFDTFDSKVVSLDGEDRPSPAPAPFYAFGLLSFFEREYENSPTPVWHSVVRPVDKRKGEGEKHPSKRAHSERLNRLQQSIYQATARHIGAKAKDPWPVLKTDISDEKERSLKNIHKQCDWVITLDRNAGVEYFDSPRDNPDIYDTYVIDCVPERDDLGCLQLVTSTGNLEEMHDILARALGEMGLDHSAKNTQFLMQSLKALSGRLVIRLTGNIQAQISEIVALAFSYAFCKGSPKDGECILSLDQGFFIPVDDILDILPPMKEGGERAKGIRPDLIYVSVIPRRGLRFQFIEVKYRSNLYSARDPDLRERIEKQIRALRERWEKGYFEETRKSIRAIRRAKLARVLHFYAKKAHRHGLSDEKYKEAAAEIDKMIEKGGDYSFANSQDKEAKDDRGWVFCPEYTSKTPTKISLDDADTSIYLFGPGDLMDTMPRGRLLVSEPSPESAARDSSHPSICFGKDKRTGADVNWGVTIKGNPHLLIGGLPGMGKTTCLLNLCKQMSAKGIVPIVFSFHQDIDEKLVEEVGSIRFVDFDGLDFNPLQVMDKSRRNAYLDAAADIRDIFSAIFPDIGSIQAGKIRDAVKRSFTEQGWGTEDADESEEAQTPAFGRFLEILREEKKPDRGLRNLMTRLDELEDYGFFETREAKSSLWDSEQPIVIRVHRTQNDNLQRAFASLVFYGLYKDMFKRGLQDRITHALIFDEAHRAAGLKLIPTMAKECRKYGISLVLASQEAKDFDPSVFSAIANYLVLRLNESDAKSLVRNVASSQQERELMDRIKQMERFEALYFQEGRRKPNLVGLSS